MECTSPVADVDWLRRHNLQDEEELEKMMMERQRPDCAGCSQSAQPLPKACMAQVRGGCNFVEKTPELAQDAIGADAGSSPAPPPTRQNTFSMFRTIAQRKVLVVVRHGESEFNAALRSARWSEPRVFDPHLTVTGCAQALSLRKKLAAEFRGNRFLRDTSLGDVLWVSSPLRRALQTMLLACPVLPQFCVDAQGLFRAEHLQRELERTKHDAFPKIKITSLVAERVLTTGDVGSPASELQQEYARLAPCMDIPCERWWWQEQENCGTRGVFGRRESTASFRARIAQAERFLAQQPERVVVLFGHSVFWKAFFRMNESLQNCAYRVLHW